MDYDPMDDDPMDDDPMDYDPMDYDPIDSNQFTLICVSEDKRIILPTYLTLKVTHIVVATTVKHSVMMDAINGEHFEMDEKAKKNLIGIIQNKNERSNKFLQTMVPKIQGDAIIFINGCTVAICNNLDEFLNEQNTLDGMKLYEHLFKENEILLIVGIADGLETELVDDIRVTCRKAGLESRIDSILSKCSSTSDEKIEIVERSDHTLLRIIVSPTIQEFEEFMERAILECCCRLSLTIVYCGHGTQAGAICLFDGDYDGTELKELFDKQCIGHFPSNIQLCLNCCYAINVASKINNINELEKLINLFPILDDTHKEESICTISQAYYGDQKANDKIQNLMKDKLKDRSFFSRSWGQLSLYVFPLSVGILKAQGLLCVALGVQQTTDEAQRVQPLKFRSRWYEKEDHNSKEYLKTLFAQIKSLLPENSSTPMVKAFGAKHGDSALFRWKKWNVLIDGGYYVSKDPCFRESICKLKQLDLVVLTHGDDDHIKGLLPLFKKLSNDRKDDLKTYKKFVKKAAFLHPDTRDQRTWLQAKKLYTYAKDAEIECTDIRNFVVKNQKNKLVIKFIHPPPKGKVLERAITELQNARSDLINESSLVVYIECWIDRRCKHRLLFTGDSYGKDVIEALKNNKLLDKHFSYVDMPHHGSKLNDHEMFLQNIKTQNIGVSTDGSRKYKHPDTKTLEEISNYMERTPSCHLHFNYKQDKYDELLHKFGGRVHCPPDKQSSGFELDFGGI